MIFCFPFFQYYRFRDTNKGAIKKLLVINHSLLTLAEKEEFTDFWKSFQWKEQSLNDSFSIYQSLLTPLERTSYVDFCKLFKWENLNDLLSIYQSLLIPLERISFIDFCKPFLPSQSYPQEKDLCINVLFSFYQALSPTIEKNLFTRLYKDKFLIFYKSLFDELLDFELEAVKKLMQNQKHLIRIEALLPIFQSCFTLREEDDFTNFCSLHMEEKFDSYPSREQQKINQIKYLFLTYKTFSSSIDRNDFISFCKLFLSPNFNRTFVNDRFTNNQNEGIKRLISIFKYFSTQDERLSFFDFCKSVANGNPGIYDTENILIIYGKVPIFSEAEKKNLRDSIIKFYGMYKNIYARSTGERGKNSEKEFMIDLVSVYNNLPQPEDRFRFFDFCQPYQSFFISEEIWDYGTDYYYNGNFRLVFDMYKNIRDSPLKENFYSFMGLHTKAIPNTKGIFSSYKTRTYLRYMRIDGALKAEKSLSSSRIQSMYETNIDSLLPIFWVRDPLLKSIRNSATANAHDFDSIYELDRFILCSSVG